MTSMTDDSMIRCIEPGGLEISLILNDFRRICVDFMDSWGIWCPWFDFLWISSIFIDFRWICVDVMESRGPRSGGVWQPAARDYTGVVAL